MRPVRVSAAEELMSLGAVTAQTAFCHSSIPELGLHKNFKWDWRVYILACEGGMIYCGIEQWADLVGRMVKHDRGEGAEYTKQHKPTGVLLCWPVPTRAGEAYIFAQMLALQDTHGQLDKIGGWVQTSVNPSPLQRVVFEEQRRQLRNRCFRCGLAGHYDEQCSKPREGAPYRCPGCKKEVIITSRGQSVLMGPAAKESPVLTAPQQQPMEQLQQASSPSSLPPAQQLPTGQPQQSPSSSPPSQKLPMQQQKQEAGSSVQAPPQQGGTRKRPASAVSVRATPPFAEIWGHPTDFRRYGRFGSLADLLRLMGSGAAQRAAGRPGEKVGVWSRRWDWREYVDYMKDVEEFGNRRLGGGPGGMGLSESAAQRVYEELKDS